MIAIVDYGVGNLFSLSSSVRSLGAEVRVTHEAADLHAASHILLPGVGAFGDAMAKLARYSFDIVLCDFDLGNGYDGLHLLEEAKTRNLLKQSCVFMIVSGERRSQRVLAAAELEPDGYLIKPFTGEQLRVRLDRAMRRREAFRCVDDALKQNDLLVLKRV